MIGGDALNGLRVYVGGGTADPAFVELEDLCEFDLEVDAVGILTRALELRYSRVPFGNHDCSSHCLIRKCPEEFLKVVTDRVPTISTVAQGAPVGGVGLVEGAQRFEVLGVVGIDDRANRGSGFTSTHFTRRIYQGRQET